ncbi:hypothetical protein N8I77_000187 [Diaporthe amygdali]|uniref:Enoyl reductase (ER) domain-containing protein n=1 Tax=Phomopsis amygdali TaxID=1214568 RepID=A0AAD9W9L4_PHOAM|nr:hypothetical protein N8I77_000187 [Diaporthe amygdali]
MSSSAPPRTSVGPTQWAIVQDATGKPTIVTAAPVPVLRPGDVLVKTTAVALKPSDYKMGAAFPSPGANVGGDFAGRVVDILPGAGDDGGDLGTAKRQRLRVGDLVCGQVHDSNPADPGTGSFAEYVRAPADLVLRVPDSITPARAATLGTPLLTSCLALWGSLRLPASPASPAKDADPVPVLVYGGSTATGTMAIQLLKLSGYDPVTTCSPRNCDLVKSFGASAVFDYTREGVGSEIRAHTKGRLRHALDCITDQGSVTCCYAALGRPGGRYASLERCSPEWRTRDAVKAEFVMMHEAFGKEVKLGGDYGRPANAQLHRLAVDMYRVMQNLLDDGKIVPHPAEMAGHGLQEVLEGLRVLKSGSVSGKRLVVMLE